MMRRGFMAGGAAAALAAPGALVGCASAAGGGGSTQRGAAGPIVLVHGAWHGGWCWQRVVPLLAAAGHAVYTPTLTGLGDRAHLARPDIDLDLHARDLQALLEMEDLHDVTLVGHSYAGFVISLVADRDPSRLRRLVYLDAFVPDDGKSVLDYVQPPQRRQALLDSGRATGYAAPVPLAALGVVAAADVAWAQPRIVPQPFGSFVQPVRLARPAGQGLAPAFVACVEPPSGSFGTFATQLRSAPGWEVHELPTGHDAMIIAPTMLAGQLVELARADPRQGAASRRTG
jgi:pimeloyl-ACP methyl ester carboxylesterase